jgi:hypothetical protein
VGFLKLDVGMLEVRGDACTAICVIADGCVEVGCGHAGQAAKEHALGPGVRTNTLPRRLASNACAE